MTSLSTQIESTRERLAREQQRLSDTAARTRRALLLAAREEAASWRNFALAEQRRASEAVRASLEVVSTRSSLERTVLRAADRTLSDVHASVRARLGKIERELAADATPATAPAEAKSDRPRAKARRPSRSAH